jgi:hypothetical protein
MSGATLAADSLGYGHWKRVSVAAAPLFEPLDKNR